MKNKICICFAFFLVFSCKHPSADIFKTERKSIDEGNDFLESYPIVRSQFENSPNVLEMQTENGVKYVWIEINGIKLRFIFDTGASSICISEAEAMVLYRQGTLGDEDILGSQETQDATGRISENMLINLKMVKIGNRVLENVKALVIGNDRAPLLLGQSALEQFGSIEIDNTNGLIYLR